MMTKTVVGGILGVLLCAPPAVNVVALVSRPRPRTPPTPPTTTPQPFTFSTTTTTTSLGSSTSADKETKEEDNTTDQSVQGQRPDLPDFGQTTVEVHTIKLSPKQQKWRRKDLFGSSLVDQTLQELESDTEFQETAKRYKEQGAVQVTREERTRRRRALDALGVPSFAKFLKDKQQDLNLQRRTPKVLQINIGLYCNQACGHCHVESSPLRTQEMMTAETAAQCLKLLQSTPSIQTLDITGGAPELNTHFRLLIRTARQLRPDDLEIIDRCNLTVLQEPGQEDLVQFLAAHGVRIIASLPCYSETNVDQQRGHGVFDRSIAALLALNEAGYGIPSSPLQLDLVYNPLGAFLPPAQDKLEQQYKQQLQDNFGILFHSLYTMTNMPIKRFADFLHRRDELRDYMELLVRNFNPDTVDNLMCRDTVSVGYDGTIYDCDFNQQLGYSVDGGSSSERKKPLTVFDLEDLNLDRYPIRTDNHCFGCTAGMGSS
jgi:radical SAM/Cys-rich protein